MMIESEAAFNRKWRMRRNLYRWGVFGWLAFIGFCIGPRFFLKLWDVKPPPANPEYFEPAVKKYCVPIVRKMMYYHRSHGVWPKTLKDCAPELVGPNSYGIDWQLTDGDTRVWRFTYYAELRHVITYDFASQEWTVTGHFAKGLIPISPIVLDPQMQPATGP